MANKTSDENLNLNVIINGNKAQSELIKLEKVQRDLKQTNKDLQAEKAKMIIQNKKGTEEWKRANKALAENRAQMKINEAEMDKLIGKIGKTGLTVAQLNKKATDLRRSLRHMIPNSPEAKQKEKELRAIEKRLVEVDVTSRRTRASLNRMNTNAVSGFKSAGKALGSYLLGYATMLLSITAIGKKWLSVNTNFQKFDAVLTTATGSAEAAAGEMAKIEEFASTTPFGVQELTEAFVKLTNQGFRPTKEELILLGDLAASTGKSFDQLAEGILDAQVGEYERLKEFGIKAQTEGDKVIFTFKGVRTEVDKNADAIREYILGLGNLEGVAGSMESISKTLGGAISNLGDSWDLLMKSFADGDGTLTRAIAKMSEFMTVLSKGVQAGGLVTSQEVEQAVKAGTQIYERGLEKITESVESNEKTWEDWQEKVKESIEKNKKLLEDSKESLSLVDKVELSAATGVPIAALMSQNKLTAQQTLLINEKIKAYEQLAAVVNANIAAEIKAEEDRKAKLDEQAKESAEKKKKYLEDQVKAQEQIRQALLKASDNEEAIIQDKYDKLIALAEKYSVNDIPALLAQMQQEIDDYNEKEIQKHKEKWDGIRAQDVAEAKAYLAERKRLLKEYGLLAPKDELKDEQKLLKQAYDDGILMEEEYLKMKAILNDNYREEERQKELDALMEKLDMYQQIANAFSALITSLKEYELSKIDEVDRKDYEVTQRRGESDEEFQQRREKAEARYTAAKEREEQKRHEVEKKYATLDAMTKVSQIALNTAMAIARAYADYQYPYSLIIAGLAGAAGLVQSGIAINEANKIKSYDSGLYDVIDHKGGRYKATRNENMATGLYTRPTVSYSKNMLVAEKRPELVVDGLTTQRLINFRPDVIQTIQDMRHSRSPQVRGYAEGNYPSSMGSSSSNPEAAASNQALEQNTMVMSALMEVLAKGIAANIGDSDIRKMQGKMNHFTTIKEKA